MIRIHMIWIVLLLTAGLMTFAVGYAKEWPGLSSAIMGFSVAKFLLVAFYFMDMKSANLGWKALLIAFAGLMGAVVVLMR
ncbi:cytochrome C oxidase subunit IV family protein [Chitinophaga caseinilytica]|uniref:Cytochrome C oxidase subunit IV family protein n=1 Tax=Chitinophaga caseinilytica TaxID=2267521 RepID=A0ABZ2YYH9_9BACT